MSSKKPTSLDVASLAGVSQPTVSRVLLRRKGVSADTRDRVLDAVRALGYTPDQRASSLRGGSTRRIAVVVLTAADADAGGYNPFYMELLGLIASAAALRGCEIIVSFQSGPADFHAGYRREGVADGIIVIGSAKNSAGWRFFAAARGDGEPIVSWSSPDDALPSIRCDNRAGAEAAVRHLVDQGRRRIAFVGPGWQQQRSWRDRRAGYVHTLNDARLPTLEPSSNRIVVREEQGFAAMAELLALPVPPDAVFAACDQLAVGVIRAVHRKGLRIPMDVAVVGFDGIAFAPYLFPSLTTVEQDSTVASRQLVDAVLAMAGGEPYVLGPVPIRLIVRESG